jgi:acyl carrier protein
MDTIDGMVQEKPLPITPGSVVPQLWQIVTEIIGEDAAEFLEFTEQSSFIRDLGMDSIQIIHLAEHVNGLYGGQVDLIGWLSSKPLNKLLTLTVGDVAAFIEKGAQ